MQQVQRNSKYPIPDTLHTIRGVHIVQGTKERQYPDVLEHRGLPVSPWAFNAVVSTNQCVQKLHSGNQVTHRYGIFFLGPKQERLVRLSAIRAISVVPMVLVAVVLGVMV